MRLASNVRPRHRDERHVDVHGTVYTFKRGPGGEFVAEVADPDHAAELIASGQFYTAGDGPVLRAPRAPSPSPPPAVAPGVDREAQALLAHTAAEIGAAVGNVSGLEVVRHAIALEAAAAKPRKSVLTLLEQTLESARLAGVAD